MKYMYTIIVILVIVMLVIGIFLVEGNSDITDYETDWETTGDISGLWNEEIIIEFKDGTTESLKILRENKLSINPFKITRDGEEITGVTYNLYATASQEGTGYTGCEIEEFTLTTAYRRMPSTMIDSFNNIIIPTVLEFDEKTQIVHNYIDLEDAIGSEIAGTYAVTWTINEDQIRYRGLPNSEWRIVERPDGQLVTMTVHEDEIYLILEPGVGTG